MLAEAVAAGVGVDDEVVVGLPNRDLLDVGKPEAVVGGPKGLPVELPNNVALLLLEVEEGAAGVLPKVVELLSIEEAKAFEVLVGLDLGGEELSVGGLRENTPDGAPNEEIPDGVEEKALWNAIT